MITGTYLLKPFGDNIYLNYLVIILYHILSLIF